MDGMLSQEEINALLNNMAESDATSEQSEPSDNNGSENLIIDQLSNEEKDVIGEISNISMGTAATTLSTLVNKKVLITTPRVTATTWKDMASGFDKPSVFIQIAYKEGLTGSNILLLKQSDTMLITDLMMGGDGSNIEGELNDLHMSAISEAMNQMMGSASTSLSSMLETMVDISPPNASLVKMDSSINNIFPMVKEPFVRVSFRMEIENLVDSEINQIYTFDFAHELYNKFINNGSETNSTKIQNSANIEPKTSNVTVADTQSVSSSGMQTMNMQGIEANMLASGVSMNGMPITGAPVPQPEVNVSPVQFQPFSQQINPVLQQENIDLIMDVPLEVTVELGRTNKSIKEILDFSPGTIIELNKLAGEPIDVLVNGKYVAKGEVVVIEESFGIRITEIIK